MAPIGSMRPRKSFALETTRFHRQRASEQGLRQAIEYFDLAIDRDPAFALAHVGIGDAYAILSVFGAEAPHAVFPRARRAVDEALRLAPDLGEAYSSLGHIKVQYEHDWAGAEDAFRRAIALNPSYAPGHQMFGLFLSISGRFAEGLDHLGQAQALEPSSPALSAVSVDLGESLSAGEAIGKVGSSGNTTEPHLHVHAVDPELGVGLPMSFDGRAPFRNRLFRN